ncbi:branched-chain amino acid ABC transporter permease [Sporichthya polymorpha]|uniref:branched-chain amino acid ABC transporter permease n=1 Tax=Sporichthya polymorpha TaxID=35751 RepID=UPI0003702A68|nr:branched-chain amino acid ABC transporter permease [Sporichthya polymorpha]
MSDETLTADPPAEAATHRGRGGGLDVATLFRWGVRLVIAILVLTPPFYFEPSWLRVGQYVMIGAVGAIGLTLLTGQAGQLSLAHPFFMFVGGTTYCVLGSEDAPGKFGVGLPSLVALVGAIAVTAALGMAFAPVSARVKGVYLGVATLSLVYVGLYLGQQWTSLSGGTASGRPSPDLNLFGLHTLRAEPEITLFGTELEREHRVWFLFALILLIAYLLAVGAVRSRPGRAWRAIRDSESAASALGVNVKRVRAEAFAISSAYAGLAGVMTVMWYRLLKPDESEFAGTYSIVVAIAFLAMILIGGLGSVGGAIAGAALVFGLPGALTLMIGGSEMFGTSGAHAITPTIFTAFVYGAAIILVVLFEPGGLAALGRRLKMTFARTQLGSTLLSPKGS